MNDTQGQQSITSGIVVLYDGACPTCVEDRKRYQSWQQVKNETSGSDQVHWLDLNQAPDVLAQFSISEQAAISELHLIIDGKIVVKELDAYIVLFRQIPKFKIVAWLIGLPVIKPLLAKYYRYRVQKRLKRTNRL